MKLFKALFGSNKRVRLSDIHPRRVGQLSSTPQKCIEEDGGCCFPFGVG